MKRFVCLVIMLCLVSGVACADIVSDFNDLCYIFGCSELTEPTEKRGFIIYQTDNCTVAFKGDSRIIVEGKGDSFVPFCMAAIMTLDNDTKLFTENSGIFLPRYLLARSGDEQTGESASGFFFVIQQSDAGFVFTIGK